MDESYELAHSAGPFKAMGETHLTQRGSVDRDQSDLMRLGKKPVLKVGTARPENENYPN